MATHGIPRVMETQIDYYVVAKVDSKSIEYELFSKSQLMVDY